MHFSVPSLIALVLLTSCGKSAWESFDQDNRQQCLLLKSAYTESLTAAQIDKVQAYAKAEDPEMLRAYLLGLAKAENDRYVQELAASGWHETRAQTLRHGEMMTLVAFYEDWVKPSPAGRAKYAEKRQQPVMDNLPLDYTVSAEGPGCSMIVFRAKKADLPNAQFRDAVVAGKETPYASAAAVGFVACRLETSEGKGFTIKLTPQGGFLALLSDDFK